MAYYVKNADIFGRIGTGLGKGLAEQVPQEIERNRLASGLKNLGEQKNLSPFQQFAALSSLPGVTPQMIQSGAELLRQQGIRNGFGNSPNQQQPNFNTEYKTPNEFKYNPELETATTPEGSQAPLKPYIPPSAEEKENWIRKEFIENPHRHRDIESATNFVNSQIASNREKSNALIEKGRLEDEVQQKSEKRLKDEIETLGAQVPGKSISKLQRKAVNAVKKGEMSIDEAKNHFGDIAETISRNFANLKTFGGLGILNKKPHKALESLEAVQHEAKKYEYQKDAADQLIAEGFTPEFSYAQMYPVKDIPKLNSIFKKDLPKIEYANPLVKREYALIGGKNPLANLVSNRTTEKTLEIAPDLAEAMGRDGSPLSVAYELDKRGYDSSAWKRYLLDNIDNLNLSDNQKNELQQTQPGYFGLMQDWWLNSFSGVK